MSAFVYIIVADNGGSYEDHSTHTVCAIMDRKAAETYADVANAEARAIDERFRKRQQRYFDDKTDTVKPPKRPRNKYDPGNTSDDLYTYSVQELLIIPPIGVSKK